MIRLIISSSVLLSACAPSDKEKKFDEYCEYVKLSVRQDAHELTDPRLQQQASDRFYEGFSGRSYREMMMCATKPVDFSRHDECWLKKDYDCLANMAKAAADAMP